MGQANDIEIFKRALNREKAARKEAERILEEKSFELYNVTEELKNTNIKLEKILREKTLELEGVFLNIIDAYIVMDLDANVLKLNDAAIKMLGYNIDTAPLNLWKIVKKEYEQYTVEAFKELYETGVYTNFRIVLITKSGEEKLVQVNSSIVYNSEGKPIAAQGILRDITKQESDKELISQQKKQLDIIIDHSPIGISLSKKDDKELLLANNSLCEMLGYSFEELKQMQLQDLTHPDDKEISNIKRNQLYNNEISTYSLDKRYIKKNGEIVWAKTNVTGVRGSSNSIKFHVTTIEDITDKNKLEKQKEELLKSLERQNEQLNDYAHIVSHDLKSPLRSISALLSWTKEDFKKNLGQESLDNLNLMENKVEKMDKLINDILNYSSIEKEDLNSELVDLNRVVNDILSIIFIPNKINVILKRKLPNINADGTRVKQVFQNLISNAVTYIDKEEGLVEIDFSESKDFFIFSVKDNGIGIPIQYREKIFKMFSTLGNYEKSSGIGLNIVKKIVELHKGEIWLESQESIGSTFYFSIPKKT